MSSFPSGPNDHAPAPRQTSAETPPGAEGPAAPISLDSVLERTERLLSGNEPLEVADIEAVRDVARRYPNEPLSLEPIVVELVRAILHVHFRALPSWHSAWHDASRHVAETLFEDPVSRERLAALWGALSRGES